MPVTAGASPSTPSSASSGSGSSSGNGTSYGGALDPSSLPLALSPTRQRALRSIAASSLLLSVVKIVYEFHAGHALLARDLGNGASLLPAAHAVGVLVGLAVCFHCPRSFDSIAHSAVLIGAHYWGIRDFIGGCGCEISLRCWVQACFWSP